MLAKRVIAEASEIANEVSVPPKKMIKEQKRIDRWFKKKNWEYFSPLAGLARLIEEVGEFARIINHVYGEKKKKDSETSQDVEDELGDILYALACFANKNGFDLDTALEKSIKKVESRDKDRYKK